MGKFMRNCALAALILAIAFSFGCAPAANNSGAAAAGAVPPNGQPSRQITLTLWHIWATDSDTNKVPFEKALSLWNETHPNIRINVEATENETYKVKIRTAMAVNEAPDIFFSWGAGFAEPFVESGKVLPLNDYLGSDVTGKLLPDSLDNFTYNGKVYALPIFMVAGILYCNQEIFNRYGVGIPDTYDELLKAVRVFKDHGATPLGVGEKDGWPGIFYQNVLAIRTAGIDKCNSALRKETTFDQEPFVESARRLTELIDAGAFNSGCMQLTQHEADVDFMNGRTAMYYTGSWATATFEGEDSPIRGKIAVRNFPVIENAEGDGNGFVGGAIDTFMINSATEYKDEAVQALVFLDENLCRESFLAGAGIPAWKIDTDRSKISPLASDIMNLLDKRDGFVLAWDTFLSGSEAQFHINLVTDLFAGRIAPEDFGREMQKLNANR